MKELLEVIAKALVDKHDEVRVDEVDKENTIVLKLHVADGDMGKVIGQKGRIAKNIRTLIKACAAKTDKKVIVDIVDD